MSTLYELRRFGAVRRHPLVRALLKDRLQGLGAALVLRGDTLLLLPRDICLADINAEYIYRHLCHYANEPQGIFRSQTKPPWLGFMDVSSERFTLTYQEVPPTRQGIQESICKVQLPVESMYNIDLTTGDVKRSVFKDLTSLIVIEVANPVVDGKEFKEINKLLRKMKRGGSAQSHSERGDKHTGTSTESTTKQNEHETTYNESANKSDIGGIDYSKVPSVHKSGSRKEFIGIGDNSGENNSNYNSNDEDDGSENGNDYDDKIQSSQWESVHMHGSEVDLIRGENMIISPEHSASTDQSLLRYRSVRPSAQMYLLNLVLKNSVRDSISGVTSRMKMEKVPSYFKVGDCKISPIAVNLDYIKQLTNTMIRKSEDGKNKTNFQKTLKESIKILNSKNIVEKIRRETFSKHLKAGTKSAMSIVRHHALALLELLCQLSEPSSILSQADKLNKKRESDEKSFKSKGGEALVSNLTQMLENTLSGIGLSSSLDNGLSIRMFSEMELDNRIQEFPPAIQQVTPCGPCGIYSVHFSPHLVYSNGSRSAKVLLRISIEMQLYSILCETNSNLVTSPAIKENTNNVFLEGPEVNSSESTANGEERMDNTVTEILEMSNALPSDFNIPISQKTLFSHPSIRYAIELLNSVKSATDPYTMFGILAAAYDSIQLAVPDLITYIDIHSDRTRRVQTQVHLTEMLLAYCICIAQASTIPRILRFIASSIDVANYKVMTMCLEMYKNLIRSIKDIYKEKQKSLDLEEMRSLEDVKTQILLKYEHIKDTGVSTLMNSLKDIFKKFDKDHVRLKLECVEFSNVLQTRPEIFVDEFNAMYNTIKELQTYINPIFKLEQRSLPKLSLANIPSSSSSSSSSNVNNDKTKPSETNNISPDKDQNNNEPAVQQPIE